MIVGQADNMKNSMYLGLVLSSFLFLSLEVAGNNDFIVLSSNTYINA